MCQCKSCASREWFALSHSVSDIVWRDRCGGGWEFLDNDRSANASGVVPNAWLRRSSGRTTNGKLGKHQTELQSHFSAERIFYIRLVTATEREKERERQRVCERVEERKRESKSTRGHFIVECRSCVGLCVYRFFLSFFLFSITFLWWTVERRVCDFYWTIVKYFYIPSCVKLLFSSVTSASQSQKFPLFFSSLVAFWLRYNIMAYIMETYL